jgi:hypothetical protein
MGHRSKRDQFNNRNYLPLCRGGETVLENSVTVVTHDTPGSIAKVVNLEFFIFSSRKEKPPFG